MKGVIVLFLLTCAVSKGFSFSRLKPKIPHSYTHSSGLLGFGSGRSHTYPHSTGLSGSGRSHTYPHSPGLSGSGRSHTYPHSTGRSGNSNSGNMRHTYTQQQNVNHNSYSSRTEVHHHYHYNPPQQISYGSTYHPVYQGHPPAYVYEYRNSGSRYDNLLTGLALYNLGRSSARRAGHNTIRQYNGRPGEICKLGISKRTGEYEETRINCNLISSFILEDASSPPRNDQQQQHVVKNTTQVQVTTVNGTGNSSVTTVTVTSNTVEDALQAKGPSITVIPGMTCYMIRIFRDTTSFRKPVDCGLLQEYARSSLHPNSEIRLMPHVTLLFNFVIICFVL